MLKRPNNGSISPRSSSCSAGYRGMGNVHEPFLLHVKQALRDSFSTYSVDIVTVEATHRNPHRISLCRSVARS